MTTYYYCNKGTLAVTNCIDGSASAVDNTNIATPRKSLAQFAAQFATANAGDQFLFAQGACWDEESTGQIKNSNSTKANPIIIGSYDASSVWTGGAGIKPIWINTTIQTTINFNKGTLTHSEGHTIRGLDVRGGGSNFWGILGGGDLDAVIIEDCSFSGMTIGIQANSATNSSSTSDGITSDWIIRRNSLSNMSGMGILIGMSKVVIENNTFLNIGTAVTDHSIYCTGAIVQVFPQTISSITGNGTTATLTTAAPHGIASGSHFTIGVTGSTSSGTGTFNVTGGVGGVVGTVTGANTITYSCTGTPTASVVGAYTITLDLPQNDTIIRNNTSTDQNVGGAGLNKSAHFVFHGNMRRLLVENNTIIETTPSVNTASVGIEIDDGGYSTPEDYESFNSIVIRNNTIKGLQQGIALDLAVDALVESNYIYTTYTTSQSQGIRMRSKGQFALTSTQQSPNRNIIRNNTIYLKNAPTSSIGIGLQGNVSDPLTGTGHQLYNNLIVLEAPATTSVMAFNCSNMTSAMFSVKDYNYVVYTGATIPKWEDSAALGSQTTGGDTHSTFISSASLTTGQPFFTSPGTSAAVGSSFGGNSGAHPTLRPYLGIGGVARTKTPTDIGAYEIGATTVVANSQTTLSVA